MCLRKINRFLIAAAVCMSASMPALASVYSGQVTFGGLPLPGATVTAVSGDKTISVTTDERGAFRFDDLADGPWKIEVKMLCFETVQSNITVAPQTTPGKWELKLLPMAELKALATAPSPTPTPTPSAPTPTSSTDKPEHAAAQQGQAEIPKPASEANQDSSDGLLVNGSVNNAATSQFSLNQAFGNRRFNTRNLYNGGFAVILDNSALDARQYSLSGFSTPKPVYDRITAGFTFGGPLKIPHLLPRNGPNFFVGYQWTRNHTAQTDPALVPTLEERAGNLAGVPGQPAVIMDPSTGQPFPNNQVPVSPQAAALLNLYPLPNVEGNPLYNFQIPVLNSSHQDELHARMDKTIGRRDQVYGTFNFESIRSDAVNLFSFVDTTDTLGLNANINWSHRVNQHLFLYTAYHFSRLRALVRPQFENKQNISGDAGITGNNQDPANWGPPALSFNSINSLSDAQSAFNRNLTDGYSASAGIYRGHHNITVGGDLRKEQFNDLFQQDPRGTFGFTGAATGSDIADFLIGVPDTSSVAFGNADKYFRQTVYDAYLTDDWRVMPILTINAGARYEYGAPMTELKNRLVNLDVASGFAQAAPVLASDPVGPVTGRSYSRSLVRPDRSGIEPRVGFSWRPIPASTIVVRGGYGIYHDTSVYLSPMLQLAQQAPLSKSLKQQNSGAACPLTLADAFTECGTTTPQTFGIDPNFRVGYAQIWQLAVQRDLPWALQMTATYMGVKGTHGAQQFLPNSYPVAGSDPCPGCPSGYLYEISGGNSTRQSGQLQLRRRLRAGFAASLLYTYSKSIDDDATLGGQGHQSSAAQTDFAAEPAKMSSAANAQVAQNWLDLKAERSLSSFDQRHLLNLQAQYTTGQGLEGGTLLGGWRGRVLKEWTLMTQFTVGTGMPETPVFPVAIPGTGWIGPMRPDLTGAPVYGGQNGAHLNAAAYTAPLPAAWGNAGRNSINGPNTFSLDGAMQRTFRPNKHFFLDARIDATNLLNHPVFTSWNTIVQSTQFGLPQSVNQMRSMQVTMRVRF